MCDGFGAVVLHDLSIHFVMPDRYGDCYHTDILSALVDEGKIGADDDMFVRQFVKVECPDWKIKSFWFDEPGTLPAWVEENVDEIKNKVSKLLDRISKDVSAYMRAAHITSDTYNYVLSGLSRVYDRERELIYSKKYSSKIKTIEDKHDSGKISCDEYDTALDNIRQKQKRDWKKLHDKHNIAREAVLEARFVHLDELARDLKARLSSIDGFHTPKLVSERKK